MRCLLDRSRIRCSSAAPANLVITSLSTPGGSKTNGDVVRRGDQSQPLFSVVAGAVGGCSIVLFLGLVLPGSGADGLPRARPRSYAPSPTAPGVRSPGVPGRRESTTSRCRAERFRPRGRLRRARRVSRTRRHRSREVPPRLLRSTTPRNDARCLPTSRSTTNNPYTHYRARASGESGAAGHVGAKTGPFFGLSEGNCLPSRARGRQPG